MIIEDCLNLGLLMRGEIIWTKSNGTGGSCAWGSWKSAKNPTLRDVHEYILTFSKGDYSREFTGENDITRDEFMTYTQSVWNFPPESAKRVKHPAPFPLELPKRLIKLYSFKGDTVLDPFSGSGSTVLASKILGRNFIAFDTNQSYNDIATSRLRELENLLNEKRLFSHSQNITEHKRGTA
jgi:site-specific DNA-methyltransferase (adenine-specific)